METASAMEVCLMETFDIIIDVDASQLYDEVYKIHSSYLTSKVIFSFFICNDIIAQNICLG